MLCNKIYIFYSSIIIYIFSEKIRETTDVLERRVHQMEVDLEGEVKEREALSKQLRKSEKSLSETTALMTESQESEESLKGQVSVIVL